MHFSYAFVTDLSTCLPDFIACNSTRTHIIPIMQFNFNQSMMPIQTLHVTCCAALHPVPPCPLSPPALQYLIQRLATVSDIEAAQSDAAAWSARPEAERQAQVQTAAQEGQAVKGNISSVKMCLAWLSTLASEFAWGLDCVCRYDLPRSRPFFYFTCTRCCATHRLKVEGIFHEPALLT